MKISIGDLWTLIGFAAAFAFYIGWRIGEASTNNRKVVVERNLWISRITRARLDFASYGHKPEEVLVSLISTADKLHVTGDWSKT